MSILSQSICSILLASSFLFNGAYGRELLGYRIVPQEEADFVNEHNKPYTEEKDYERFYDQMGKGLHLVNEPASWWGREWEWYCAFEADLEKIKEATKVWIPHVNYMYYENLWYREEREILEYITTIVSENPEKALRFSIGYFSARTEEMTMAIPLAAVQNNDYDLWGKCWRTRDELKEYANRILDWRSWEIIGTPGEREKTL
ncbi:uncharacterized protein L3040_001563 [Drepanopeziza brunnea f. sp. 'multigermtubi']|uniref:Uncharacterized protein n=1 Tax=Marssonina brunnea f. sp. multigermtubi (strain MB_m1) TaxID=1072389 RepID=K1XRJ2_MARBU|nr:uncharacterized protein MBM_06410 [Drepanopeziza brunnea f. sp. 'multigermtubi' MB_m1]EKD15194.1 hypothetical protein MBM_06410 [Drepanopeziza brunnea f. sp. 'multigermtubi' MB_m1]KAJ5051792.1 hypothetical protein L3040_001563 [Drepanopeziza brunnea f. sp. 'multigermtubi']